jgi:succinyl-diaminopimelate desuccinylase
MVLTGLLSQEVMGHSVAFAWPSRCRGHPGWPGAGHQPVTRQTDEPAAALRVAREDRDSVVGLTRELVRIPSRAGTDPYGPVLGCMSSWLAGHGMLPRRLPGPGGDTVALVCEITGGRPGPRYVLDACLDTAPFGDQAAWTYPPTSAKIVDGWLHGRGSADSKAGAAIFAHVAARLVPVSGRLAGSLVLLFDVDEHTGGFGGARAYFEGPGAPGRADGVMIGYPGRDHLVTGGRGVLRAQLHARGIASHSGGRTATPNAITKAARLVSSLADAKLPAGAEPAFPLPPRLTVTEISGGAGYSAVPDVCTLKADVRLTPAFDAAAAEALLRSLAGEVDGAWPGTEPTRIQITMCWPPYRLGDDSPLKTALLTAARQAGLSPAAKVAGPPNIGNYLAGLGIEATAGFGVEYQGLHGTDERIRIDSIPAIQAAYHQPAWTCWPPPDPRRSGRGPPRRAQDAVPHRADPSGARCCASSSPRRGGRSCSVGLNS